MTGDELAGQFPVQVSDPGAGPGLDPGPGPGPGPDPEEQEYLRSYDPRAFPPMGVTVDIVVLAVSDGRLDVLLIRRAGHPHRGRWALPGGFVGPAEDLSDAASRELAEETGAVIAPSHLEQLGSYGRPDRDPRMRIVSVVYLALLPSRSPVVAADDAREARYWPVAEILRSPGEASVERPRLAFDHERIVADAVARATVLLETTSLATALVKSPFTLDDLRLVYEAVWGVPLEPEEFVREVLAVPGLVIPTGRTGNRRGIPVELYRRGSLTSLPTAVTRPGSGSLPAQGESVRHGARSARRGGRG